MEHLADEDIQSIVDLHRAVFVDDMGFNEEEFNLAVREIRKQGGLYLEHSNN